MGRSERLLWGLSAGRATLPCSLRYFRLDTTPDPAPQFPHQPCSWLPYLTTLPTPDLCGSALPACLGLASLQQPALQLLGGIKSLAIKEASSQNPRPLPLESTLPSQARDKPFLSFLAGSTHGFVCPYLAIIQMDCGSPEAGCHAGHMSRDRLVVGAGRLCHP